MMNPLHIYDIRIGKEYLFNAEEANGIILRVRVLDKKTDYQFQRIAPGCYVKVVEVIKYPGNALSEGDESWVGARYIFPLEDQVPSVTVGPKE